MSKNYNGSQRLKTILLNNENYSPPNPSTKNKKPMLMTLFALISFFFIGFTAKAQLYVIATAGDNYQEYTTLTSAFTAINNGAHQGAITIVITQDVDDGNTSPVLFNSGYYGLGTYSSVLITTGEQSPLGPMYTVTGAYDIVFDGADNVTINGYTKLTFNSVAGSFPTIVFQNGASNNTITNCTVLGNSINHGLISLKGDSRTANGNDNIVISNNFLGATDVTSYGIMGYGNTTTDAIANSNITISNNRIFNCFNPYGDSSGIITYQGCHNWTITNNRFYQTAPRTWILEGGTNIPINIQGLTGGNGAAYDFTITGNIIGYASDTQTGTYALSGNAGVFRGIVYNGLSHSPVNISSNTIAGVSLTEVTSSGTAMTSPFLGIMVESGVGTTDSNTIGSQSATGSLVFSTTTTAATDVYGIVNFGRGEYTSSNNSIGGISVNYLLGSGSCAIYAIRSYNLTDVAMTHRAYSNFIGGTVPNSIQLNTPGSTSNIFGIHGISYYRSIFELNTIRNLTAAGGAGSVVGIYCSNAITYTFNQNTISNMKSTNATAAFVVTGIQASSLGSGFSSIEKNFIYGLTNATTSALGEINGIRTAILTGYFRNNMISLGGAVSNSMGAEVTNTSTTGINGILETGGSCDFFHNSVNINGTSTSGFGCSYAFNSTVTANTRSVRNNIFVNNRANSGAATGTHYGIKINGTTANPAGLTLNNNLYFGTGPFGFFNGLNVTTLANWKTTVGQDIASYFGNPQFMDTAAAVPNLHINPAVSTLAEANGSELGVNYDFDGQWRGGLTPVDIGADAGNFLVVTSTASVLNLKLFIEGYYTGGGMMRPVLNNLTGTWSLDQAIFVNIELRNATAPFALVIGSLAILKTDGTATFAFSTMPNGSYYIVVKSYNTIATWSSSPQFISPSAPLTYDFTTSASKAYGSNMKNLGGGVFGIYSGDINQDEVIDASDAPALFDDVANSAFGDFYTDLNGDGATDNSDIPFFADNSDISIYSIHP